MRRWLSCCVLCLMPSLSLAQAGPFTAADGDPQSTSRALLRGRVVDASSAAIVGAQVTVTADRPGAPRLDRHQSAG